MSFRILPLWTDSKQCILKNLEGTWGLWWHCTVKKPYSSITTRWVGGVSKPRTLMIKSYKAGLLTLWEPAHFQFTLFWEQNLLCFLQSLLVCELSFLSYAKHCTACLCLGAHLCRMLPLVAPCLRQLLKLCRDLEGKGPLKARLNFGSFFTSSLAVVHGPGNYSFKIAGFLSFINFHVHDCYCKYSFICIYAPVYCHKSAFLYFHLNCLFIYYCFVKLVTCIFGKISTQILCSSLSIVSIYYDVNVLIVDDGPSSLT